MVKTPNFIQIRYESPTKSVGANFKNLLKKPKIFELSRLKALN
jgi:hypothetical protein